ncbi:hypothetical protein Hanom_Chr01g00003961 [Helianthus anomalus]
MLYYKIKSNNYYFILFYFILFYNTFVIFLYFVILVLVLEGLNNNFLIVLCFKSQA